MAAAAIAAVGAAISIAKIGMQMSQNAAQAGYSRKQVELQKKLYNLDLKSSYTDFLGSLSDIQTQYIAGLTTQTELSQYISAYEEALGRYDDFYSLQVKNAVTQNMGTYRQLMSNWQTQQVVSAERGQTGTTAAMLEAMQKQEVVNFAGIDLALDSEGGVFGSAISDAKKDLDADRKEIGDELDWMKLTKDLNSQTLDSYIDTYKKYMTTAAEVGWQSGKSHDELMEELTPYADFLSGVRATDPDVINSTESLRRMLENFGRLPSGQESATDSHTYRALPPTGQDFATNANLYLENLLNPYVPMNYKVTTHTGYHTHGGDKTETTDEFNVYDVWMQDAEGNWNIATDDELEKLYTTYLNNGLFDGIKTKDINRYGAYTGPSFGRVEGANSPTRAKQSAYLSYLYAKNNKIGTDINRATDYANAKRR